ncbi:ABC transporter permease [Brenneria goodwinii]|uniref:ABC-type spermidine/putrescine transport system, permease component I n=1 Tax=Brenneria goodwinii TaxID=1109412 RepID=A0A0G4JY30_9GAMM|nr:ABC transporter permease [Brenneria goodwinii]CPR18647.1 ABC-type spermidine/putrescine transport system, permease component I [Brenneria goodwinii]
MSDTLLPPAPEEIKKALPLRPWLMSAPGIILFTLMLIVPLAMTVLLAFNVNDPDLGAQPGTWTLDNFIEIVTDPWYYGIFWRTLWICLVVTVICVLIGVPQALILNRMRAPWRSIMLVVVLAPLLVSVVVRSFGWSLLLGDSGLVNKLLLALGIGQLHIMYTEAAIVIALVHVMLPFMIIPVWTTLQKIDPSVSNAALSLSASRLTTLRRIILPQLTPGILSGCLIVFGLSASSFVIPGILGGRSLKVVATLVYDQYLSELNWPLGAAIAIILLVANLVIMFTYNRLLEQRYKKKLED